MITEDEAMIDPDFGRVHGRPLVAVLSDLTKLAAGPGRECMRVHGPGRKNWQAPNGWKYRVHQCVHLGEGWAALLVWYQSEFDLAKDRNPITFMVVWGNGDDEVRVAGYNNWTQAWGHYTSRERLLRMAD